MFLRAIRIRQPVGKVMDGIKKTLDQRPSYESDMSNFAQARPGTHRYLKHVTEMA